jgi:hypothetical protein
MLRDEWDNLIDDCVPTALRQLFNTNSGHI